MADLPSGASEAPPEAPAPAALGGRVFRRTLAAFSYRDFRVLWLGAFTSTVGTWMQKVAQSWLVFDLTRSSIYLGLDDFLGQLPILLFTMIGGVIADRHDRRLPLLGSQFVQMACAFTLAALVFWNWITVWHILMLSFVSGCAQAFGGPAHQSLVPTLVDRKDLPNAIALNSIQFNLARAVGPLLAGAALAAWGLAACFGLNGLSFLVVIVALMSLSVTHVPPATRQGLIEELRGGIQYARSEASIVALTVLASLTTFLTVPLMTLLPVFVGRIFGEGITEYSRMLTFHGAGAVTGALIVAWLGRFRRMGLALVLVQLGVGALFTAFAISRNLWLSYALLFLAGGSLLVVFSLTSSLIQLIVPDHLRGRVVSIYLVAFRGGMPLGALASGYAASVASAPMVLAVNGVLVFVVGVYFLVRSRGVRDL
jgi:MFS family permease